jgi:hypothetical protein
VDRDPRLMAGLDQTLVACLVDQLLTRYKAEEQQRLEQEADRMRRTVTGSRLARLSSRDRFQESLEEARRRGQLQRTPTGGLAEGIGDGPRASSP